MSNKNDTEMHSRELGKLLEALSKAQAVMMGASMDSANPFFKSKYADLSSVWDACREPLTKNGLSVVQSLGLIEGQQCLVSILGHNSGQWIKSVIVVKPGKPDIQAMGAAITYCRRYALAALVGVCPEDDDGEKAMDRSKKNKKEEAEDTHEQIVESQPIELELPEKYERYRVEMFIKESAEAAGKKPEAVKRLAVRNMPYFLERYQAWEYQKAKEKIG